MMSSSRQSTSKTRDCRPARLRALGVIPDTMDMTRFCMWFSLARAWVERAGTAQPRMQPRTSPRVTELEPRCCRALPGTCLVLAAGISEPGDAGGREEQVESHGQERHVSHQMEALPVQDSAAQQVGEAQPLQGQAHRAETGVPQLHVQEIVVQTLKADADYRRLEAGQTVPSERAAGTLSIPLSSASAQHSRGRCPALPLGCSTCASFSCSPEEMARCRMWWKRWEDALKPAVPLRCDRSSSPTRSWVGKAGSIPILCLGGAQREELRVPQR